MPTSDIINKNAFAIGIVRSKWFRWQNFLSLFNKDIKIYKVKR